MLKVLKIIDMIYKNVGIIVAVARGLEKCKDELESFNKTGKLDKENDKKEGEV